MNMSEEEKRVYIAIDLKSFYASVECVERNLDPLTTNLVVADVSRTAKTVCLAVSPSLKSYGIGGRARLFEVESRVKKINADRLRRSKNQSFTESSYDNEKVKSSYDVELAYIAATPRMALYMQYSTKIFDIYLRYVAAEDMHVYSVDEVFIDVTHYLNLYQMTPHELAKTMVKAVYDETGITATAGIGTNMYLCKIAMDIVAKHVDADEDGVRIASLDEMSYRRLLWNHKPLTDFWRVGRGYAKKLEERGIETMGDVARCSLGGANDYFNEDLLYRMFGINAELLIDHAWGYENVTIADIKAYKPETNSISNGQVLSSPYDYEKTKTIVKEMTDVLVYDLIDKHIVTNQLVLTIGYDTENIGNGYKGETTIDRYGRKVPHHAHGTINLDRYTSAASIIMKAMMELFERIMDPELTSRRVYVVANKVKPEEEVSEEEYEQLDLFTFADFDERKKAKDEEEEKLKKEHNLQQALLDVKKKYGKNAILRGMNFEEGATGIQRNSQIGGHKA